jgi:hypothetical protein
LHSKVEFVSEEENVNEADALPTVPEGPEPTVVLGAAVSTLQVRVAGVASTLPAASLALTEKVCDPLESPVRFLGEVHVVKFPASSLHSKVEPDSEEENVNEADVLLTEPEGPEPMVVSGGVVSGGGAVLIVQVRVAGVASTLPAASVALTEKV